jgi:hypothetical protein
VSSARAAEGYIRKPDFPLINDLLPAQVANGFLAWTAEDLFDGGKKPDSLHGKQGFGRHALVAD